LCRDFTVLLDINSVCWLEWWSDVAEKVHSGFDDAAQMFACKPAMFTDLVAPDLMFSGLFNLS
jgi:hypothetical protein